MVCVVPYLVEVVGVVVMCAGVAVGSAVEWSAVVGAVACVAVVVGAVGDA